MEIHGNASCSSHDMAYFAGLVEGKLTAEYIYMQYQNTLADYCANETDYCRQLALFLEHNQQYMSEMISELDEDPFWYQVSCIYMYMAITCLLCCLQVGLFLDQLDGLRDGYKLSKFPAIPDIGFWLVIRYVCTCVCMYQVETRLGHLGCLGHPGYIFPGSSRSHPIYKITGFDPDSALDHVC